MSSYWGASVTRSPGGPNGDSVRYVPMAHGSDNEARLTPPPSADGGTGDSIEEAYRQVMGEQPAHVSALADEWQNLYDLLDHVWQQLLDQSDGLANDSWRSPQARDAFLGFGPGPILAYLDAWKDAASTNVTTLYTLVPVIQQHQQDMTILWRQYSSAVHDASTMQNSAAESQPVLGGPEVSFTGSGPATDADRINAVNAVRQQFDLAAQRITYAMAGDYLTAVSAMNSGHGPPFLPPNVVLNPALTAPLPPGGPPGPGAAGPPAAPHTPPAASAAPALPVPPAMLADRAGVPLDALTALAVTSPSGAPATATAPASGPPPGVSSPMIPPPTSLVITTGDLAGRELAVAGELGPATSPGVLSDSPTAPPSVGPVPEGLFAATRAGVIGNGSTGTGSPDEGITGAGPAVSLGGPGVIRPDEAMGGSPGQTASSPSARSKTTETTETTLRAPSSWWEAAGTGVMPVLGSASGLSSTMPGGPPAAPPGSSPAGTVPPVLGRPPSSTRPVRNSRPPRSGVDPVLGQGEAGAGPVLGTRWPANDPSASRLVEIPEPLRNPATSSVTGHREAQPPVPVPADRTTRRSAARIAQPTTEPGDRIISDDAWTVDTPGGPVVAAQPPTTTTGTRQAPVLGTP